MVSAIKAGHIWCKSVFPRNVEVTTTLSCIWVDSMCTWCLQKWEQGVWYLRTKVTGSLNHHVIAASWTQIICKRSIGSELPNNLSFPVKKYFLRMRKLHKYSHLIGRRRNGNLIRNDNKTLNFINYYRNRIKTI